MLGHSKPFSSRMKSKSKFAGIIVGLLCLILTVFMIAEVAHSHADIAAAGHCQLCAAAHLATDVQPAYLTPVLLLLLGTVAPGEPSPGSRAVLVTAFIRPPPTSI